MAKASSIVSFLDQLLATDEIPDRYSSNGLQVEGPEEVEKIGFCVDACQQTFELLEDCQLLVVHHGLFWPSLSRITGAARASIGFLIERKIGLYCSHLPLDYHPDYGNNAQLIHHLGWDMGEAFPPVGWMASCSPQDRKTIALQIDTLLGGQTRLLPFGKETIEKVAVSSGGGSLSMVDQAVAQKVDLFLTGEASHPLYHAAREAGLNVILGGHYATETWGVRALMPVLEERFGVSTDFVDVPTGF